MYSHSHRKSPVLLYSVDLENDSEGEDLDGWIKTVVLPLLVSHLAVSCHDFGKGRRKEW